VLFSAPDSATSTRLLHLASYSPALERGIKPRKLTRGWLYSDAHTGSD